MQRIEPKILQSTLVESISVQIGLTKKPVNVVIKGIPNMDVLVDILAKNVIEHIQKGELC